MSSRLAPKAYAELTPDQQTQFDRIARTRKPDSGDQFGGPFDPWIRSPEVAERAMSLGNYIWERTSVGRRIVEVAIIVTGRYWRSNVDETNAYATACALLILQFPLDYLPIHQR